MDKVKILEEKYINGDKSVFVLYALSLEYEKICEYEKALSLFFEIKNINPQYLPIYYQAGILNINSGNMEEARKWINEGVELSKILNDSKTELELNALLIQLDDE